MEDGVVIVLLAIVGPLFFAIGVSGVVIAILSAMRRTAMREYEATKWVPGDPVPFHPPKTVVYTDDEAS